MAQILVRDLDDATVERLKRRAQANGRSLQAEVKMVLEQHARMEMAAFWEKADRIREELKATGRTFSDSAEIIREERDR